MQGKSSPRRGFTIVELLIVIVVIAILAAITIVAYRGMQDRAQISSINSMLSQINKALQSHNALYGNYPIRTAWVSQSDASKNTFIPGLVPDVVSSLPRAPQWVNTPTFYYISDATGSNYKLLYLYLSGTTMPDSASADSQVQSMRDPSRPTRGWGYWTPGGSAF